MIRQLQENFINLRDLLKDFKNPEFTNRTKARILRYCFEDEKIAEKNKEIEEQLKNVSKEMDFYIKKVNLADPEFNYMESSFLPEAYDDYIKSRIGTDKMNQTLLRQYRAINWAQHIVISCSTTTPAIIKFDGLIKRLCLNNEIRKILSKKKIFFMIITDDELKEANSGAIKNYLFYLKKYFDLELKEQLEYSLKKTVLLSTFPAEGRINLKSIGQKFSHLDQDYEYLNTN